MSNDMDILVVEDDKVDVMQITEEFRKFNSSFNLHFAKNGQEALDKLYGTNGMVKLERLPKTIIVDIKMPIMDGNEFAQKLRSDPRFTQTPIFILTVSYTTADKLATEGLGIHHIIKPLRRDDVIHIYMSALGLIGFNFNDK